MKILWPWLAKILLVVAILEGWFLYTIHQKNLELMATNSALQSQLEQTQQSLEETRELLQAMEKKTLKGMLEETNKAVVSGWQKLLDRVESELEKAREDLSDLSEPQTPRQTPPLLPEPLPETSPPQSDNPDETDGKLPEGTMDDSPEQPAKTEVMTLLRVPQLPQTTGSETLMALGVQAIRRAC